MFFRNLELTHFRNIEHSKIEFSDRLNIFLGSNGQGKTNFLEALYFICENESFRYGDLNNLIQFKKNYSFIKSQLMKNNLDFFYQIKLLDNKKEILINDKKKTFKIENTMPVVLFSPESLSFIKESTDQRRQLLDQVISQSENQGQVLITEFKKVLRTRNKLLKDLSENKIHEQTGLNTLESLNEIYFKISTQLTLMRLRVLKNIAPYVQQALEKIEQNSNKVDFNYSYLISGQNVVDNLEENQAQFLFFVIKKRAHELRSAELTSGTSLVGPQKHDVIFLYNGNDSRFYASQGQQRSVILAFKMAQIVYHQITNGFYPILLLDDVLSELDQNKQSALVMALNEIQTQTFITSTDSEVIKKLNINRSSIFNVLNGNINTKL